MVVSLTGTRSTMGVDPALDMTCFFRVCRRCWCCASCLCCCRSQANGLAEARTRRATSFAQRHRVFVQNHSQPELLLAQMSDNASKDVSKQGEQEKKKRGRPRKVPAATPPENHQSAPQVTKEANVSTDKKKKKSGPKTNKSSNVDDIVDVVHVREDVEEAGDSDDHEDVRSVDEESIGSLKDFIVDDDEVEEAEHQSSDEDDSSEDEGAENAPQTKKRRKIVDETPEKLNKLGIDTRNIVSGKRNRKPAQHYVHPDFAEVMLCDVPDEEIEYAIGDLPTDDEAEQGVCADEDEGDEEESEEEDDAPQPEDKDDDYVPEQDNEDEEDDCDDSEEEG